MDNRQGGSVKSANLEATLKRPIPQVVDSIPTRDRGGDKATTQYAGLLITYDEALSPAPSQQGILVQSGMTGRSGQVRSGISAMLWADDEIEGEQENVDQFARSNGLQNAPLSLWLKIDPLAAEHAPAVHEGISPTSQSASAFQESAQESSEMLSLLAELLSAASETLHSLAERADLGGEAFARHREGLSGLGEAFSILSETLSVSSESVSDAVKPLSQSLLEHFGKK